MGNSAFTKGASAGGGTQQVNGWAQVTSGQALAAGHNVSSITSHGTGDYSAVWSTAFAAANAYVATMRSPGGRYFTVINNGSSTTSCRVNAYDTLGNPASGSGSTCLGMGELA